MPACDEAEGGLLLMSADEFWCSVDACNGCYLCDGPELDHYPWEDYNR